MSPIACASRPPYKDLQTHQGHKGFRKLRTFKAGGRCLDIGDPSYKKDPEEQLRPKLVDFVFEEASEYGPTIVEKVATELLSKARYLDVDPRPDNRARLGIPRLQNRHTQSIPTNQVTAISSNMKTTKGRREAKSYGSVE